MQRDYIDFCGLRFDGLDRDRLLNAGDKTTFVVTANAQIIDLAWSDRSYRKVLQSGTLTFDGQVPYLMARILNPGVRFQKISGSDLVYDVIRKAAVAGETIFFFGGSEHSNQLARQRVREQYGIAVEGCSPKVHADGSCEEDVIGQIAASNASYVFVALGAPKQEVWTQRNLDALNRLGVKLVIGCGGSIDFLANRFRRAPSVVQKMCLEGVYRLMQDPTPARLRRLGVSLRLFRHVFRKSVVSGAPLTSDQLIK
jgi:N-acetylglucosaminyldiphosphoundecaprenol N-acetyl-beta-D-mannosaminyltransferase